MDSDGKVGRAYGARTTPHMYVIDPAGTLVYAGAIDSKPTSNPADIAAATNYVKVALAESLAGKPVSTASTRRLRLLGQVLVDVSRPCRAGPCARCATAVARRARPAP